MAATTYISLDVALTITSVLEPGNPKQSLHSVSLFVLTTIWPGMCVLLSLPHVPCMTPDVTCSAALLFFILMVWIVFRALHETRPLVYYFLAAILFILAQLAYFLLSRTICDGTNAKVDGSFIATALETATVIVLYLAWQGITEGPCFSRPVCGLTCSSSTLPGQTTGLMIHTFRNEGCGLPWLHYVPLFVMIFVVTFLTSGPRIHLSVSWPANGCPLLIISCGIDKKVTTFYFKFSFTHTSIPGKGT